MTTTTETTAGRHGKRPANQFHLPARPDFIFRPGNTEDPAENPTENPATPDGDTPILIAFAGLPGHVNTTLVSAGRRAAERFCDRVNARLGYGPETWREIARLTAVARPDRALVAETARRRNAPAGAETIDYAFFPAGQGPGRPVQVTLAFPDARAIVPTSLATPSPKDARILAKAMNDRLGLDAKACKKIIQRALLAERDKQPLQ